MTIVLIILGNYIGMVVVSLLSPYVDFKKNHCEKGKKYTLEDLYNTMDNTYWVVCFTPMFNAMTVTVSLVTLLIIPLWNKIKRIRIV